MANEFKITDIVDKKAFDELTSLIAKFNETKEAYVNPVSYTHLTLPTT